MRPIGLVVRHRSNMPTTIGFSVGSSTVITMTGFSAGIMMPLFHCLCPLEVHPARSRHQVPGVRCVRDKVCIQKNITSDRRNHKYIVHVNILYVTHLKYYSRMLIFPSNRQLGLGCVLVALNDHLLLSSKLGLEQARRNNPGEARSQLEVRHAH